jgi:hypothetical protein
MRKALLVIAGMLAAFAAGEQFGLYLHRPLEVRCEGPVARSHFVDPAGAGAINAGDGSCELSWVICWRRT